MTSKIDEVLEFLALDDALHSIEEVSKALNIPSNICEIIVDFLAKYNFIQFNNLSVRINPKIRDFIIASSDEESILKAIPSMTTLPSLQKR